MDFRVLEVDGHQILLERIEDDGWKVVIGVYIDVVKRYDNWEAFDTPQAANAWTAAYTEEQARQFLENAIEWWKEEDLIQARRLAESNP